LSNNLILELDEESETNQNLALKEKSVIYSPSCYSKTVWISVSWWTQNTF